MSKHRIRPFMREHSSTCWENPGHESCALRGAVSYLTARLAHDQGRLALYRSATRSGPGTVDPGIVELAREQLRENRERDWSIEAGA